MGVGDLFGEMALLLYEPRAASVVAVDRVTVLVVDRKTLAEGLEVDGWSGALVRALAHRFCDLEQQAREAGLRRACTGIPRSVIPIARRASSTRAIVMLGDTPWRRASGRAERHGESTALARRVLHPLLPRQADLPVADDPGLLEPRHPAGAPRPAPSHGPSARPPYRQK